MMTNKLATKLIFSLLTALVATSCSNAAENSVASPDGASAVSMGLERAISSTPYAALVRMTEAERNALPDNDLSDDFAEEQITVHAQVLDTFRGPDLELIHYVMVVERGESIDFPSEPVIVTLCEEDGRFYWPGTGSSFPAKASLLHTATETAAKANAEQSEFAYCDY